MAQIRAGESQFKEEIFGWLVVSRRRALLAVQTAVFSLLMFGGQASAADLELVDEFGSRGSAPGQFQGGGGGGEDLEVAPNGNLVVSDTGNSRVQIFTPSGGFVRAFGSPGSGPGQFSFQTGLAIRNDGTIFVVDSQSGRSQPSRVQVFGAAGAYQREFPLAQPQGPHEIYTDAALDPTGTILYIGNRDAGVIRRVSTGGAAMGQFGSLGSGNGQFNFPFGIAVDGAGDLYVSDQLNNRVQKLSANGAFITKFGGQGNGPGQMNVPLDVAIEPNGDVLVADSNNFRLQEFSPSGRLLAVYDRIAGSPQPSFRPWAVTTAPSGDIYIYDITQARIVRVRAQVSPPVLGKTVNAARTSGKVLVREKGSNKFHVLTGTESIPVGSSIDATRGKVKLASAKKGGGTQSTVFFDGRFNVRQSRRTALTDVRLEGGNFSSCRGGARSAAVDRRVLRRLWGHGKGRTRTSGHNGSGTVRGTFWLTEDRCDGTFFKVRQGVVVVRDFTRHRTVVLHEGEQYLAPAR